MFQQAYLSQKNEQKESSVNKKEMLVCQAYSEEKISSTCYCLFSTFPLCHIVN